MCFTYANTLFICCIKKAWTIPRYLKIPLIRLISQVLMQLQKVCLWQNLRWFFVLFLFCPMWLSRSDLFKAVFSPLHLHWVSLQVLQLDFYKDINNWTYLLPLLALCRNFGSKTLCMHFCLIFLHRFPFGLEGRIFL